MSFIRLKNRRFEVPEIDVQGDEATIHPPPEAEEDYGEGEHSTARGSNGAEPRTVRIAERTWGR